MSIVCFMICKKAKRKPDLTFKQTELPKPTTEGMGFREIQINRVDLLKENEVKNRTISNRVEEISIEVY